VPFAFILFYIAGNNRGNFTSLRGVSETTRQLVSRNNTRSVTRTVRSINLWSPSLP